MVSFIDYYKVLGLTYPSTQVEIKRSFRELALRWHPDRNSDPTATSKMVELNEAYQILSHADTKAMYDREYKSIVTAVAHGDGKYKAESAYAGTSSYTGHSEATYSNSNLSDLIEQIRKRARSNMRAFIEETADLAEVGAKAFKQELLPSFIRYLIVSFVIFILIKACK